MDAELTLPWPMGSLPAQRFRLEFRKQRKRLRPKTRLSTLRSRLVRLMRLGALVEFVGAARADRLGLFPERFLRCSRSHNDERFLRQRRCLGWSRLDTTEPGRAFDRHQ